MQRTSRAWSERAEIARRQNQQELVATAEKLAEIYLNLAEQENEPEPEILGKANLLRKKIESTEQHRTMAAEHGLGNEAIDATYEIQAMEKELVELMASWTA